MELYLNNTKITNQNILDYVFLVNTFSKEKNSLHIYHKIKELLYVRQKGEILIEQNLHMFADYNDLIERMKTFYDENKKCLLLNDMKTISYHLFKCFDRCFNDLYIEGNNIFPLFKLNVSEFLDLEVYKYITSQQMRFFLFLYLEKFLYSFPIFSYERNLNAIVSEGFFMFNFDNLSQSALGEISFYLFIEDVNYIISIIAPIYFHSIVFYKSQQLKDKFYKIFKLIQNKKCRNVYIETEEELYDVVQQKNAYAQLEIGRYRNDFEKRTDINKSNIICDYSKFFLLQSLFQENHNEDNKYTSNGSVNKHVLSLFDCDDNNEYAVQCKYQQEPHFESLDFDDIFIKEHINYKNIRKLLQHPKDEKEGFSNVETKNAPLGRSMKTEENRIVTQNIKDFLPEDKLWSNMFNLDYLKNAASEYNSKCMKQRLTENKIADFIMKTNNYENKRTNRRNSDFHVGNVILFNKRKRTKKKERVYVDLKKTNGDVNTCIYKNNLNYIGDVENLLRNVKNGHIYIKQPEAIATDFPYEEVPYAINKNKRCAPSIEVTKRSLQLRGFR